MLIVTQIQRAPKEFGLFNLVDKILFVFLAVRRIVTIQGASKLYVNIWGVFPKNCSPKICDRVSRQFLTDHVHIFENELLMAFVHFYIC